MPFPTTKELKGAIQDILSSAQNEGRLSKLTVRIVRCQLTTRFGLEQDALNEGEYKSFIKETVHATLNKLKNASDVNADGNEGSPERKATKKDGTGGAAKVGARKRVAKSRVPSSDEEAPEGADLSENEAPLSKKASGRSKAPKPAKSTKTSKKQDSEIQYKSKEIIESSDEEDAPESESRNSTRSPKKEQNSVRPSSAEYKQKEQHKADKDDWDVEMDAGEGPGPSSSSSKLKHTTQSPKSSTSKSKELTEDPMESELSSVIDEPPKKRQKKQEKESVKSQKEEKTKRGKKEALSKDEETINKLKHMVVACGVRKVWKKEFEGLDKPSQQIKRLHSILGDLGMTPRYSLFQAKVIKERRELAQELRDVQDFEKATKRRGKNHHTSPDLGEPADQNSSDVDAPARKKHTARASIMAFLEDQSEEE